MPDIPQQGCGLPHVTPKILGIQSNILPSKLHEVENSNLVHEFDFLKSERAHK